MILLRNSYETSISNLSFSVNQFFDIDFYFSPFQMEFMETGLPEGGPDNEADPTTLDQPSGDVDYNNGYEGNDA